MVKFVCGRSGRGKTQYIFDDIKIRLANQKDEPIYLIVPDQMSFQTEFELLQQLNTGAMMQVEVLGISRFVTQMIEYLAPQEYRVFDTLAQKMLLQQAAFNQKQELTIYQQAIEKPTFIDYIHQFSRQLKGTGRSLTEGVPIEIVEQYPVLQKKLKEVDFILKAYQDKIEQDMFDLADKLQLYLTLLTNQENKKKMQQLHVYVDGYYTFNNLETEVITKTLLTAQTGMMSFCLDHHDYTSKTSLFHLIYQQFGKFQTEINTDEIVYLQNHHNRFTNNQLLDFIEKNYDAPKPIPQNLVNESFNIINYLTIEQEVMYTAQHIRHLLFEKKIRAKEIAVYLPQKDLYTPLIEKYFKQYELPYYLDLKDSMLIHPIFQWFYTLLLIAKNNWQIEDILTLLHNELFRFMHHIDDNSYYLFVDFIEQIRFPYKRIWKQDKYWQYFDNPQQLADSFNEEKTEIIQQIRLLIMNTIQNFEKILAKKKVNNAEILKNLFLFIQQQPLYEYTINNANNIEHAKYLSHVTEKQYQEVVWKQLIYIFEQAHLAIGQDKMSKDVLLQVLILGLENAEFTSVPNGFDAVMIGDFARTRFQTLHQENTDTSMGVQYAFILGVTNKFVPYAEETTSILSNEELLIMRNNNILNDILLQDEAINYQLFRFYTLITSAAKEVHLSYYQYSGRYLEEENLPSSIIESKFLEQGFSLKPHIITQEMSQQKLAVLTLDAAKYNLTKDYQQNIRQNTPLLQILNVLDHSFLAQLVTAENYQNKVIVSDNIIVPEKLSLTQIETYNACPYQYFLKYILHVSEPGDDKLRSLHTGVLLHNAYELITQQALYNHLKLNEIENPLNRIENYFKEKAEELQKHPFFNLQVNRFVYWKAEAIAKQSLAFLMENEAKSNFIPQFLEYRLPDFPIQINQKTKYLIGKLDRIDFDRAHNYFRIIDYKSSKRTIDFNKLLYGTQLQLPFYSLLASQNFQQKLAGSMYVPIIENDVLLDSSENSLANIHEALQKNYQATGLFLDEQAALLQFDQTLNVETKSLVIPYEQKKDGTANQHSAVLSENEMTEIQKFSLEKTKDTLENIERRDFAITPLREDFDYDTTPCKYCPFRTICQFDQKVNGYQDCQKKIKEKSFVKKKEKFFVEMEGEEKNDE